MPPKEEEEDKGELNEDWFFSGRFFFEPRWHIHTQSSRSSHPVVHDPPLTIILTLALILNKFHNNNYRALTHTQAPG